MDPQAFDYPFQDLEQPKFDIYSQIYAKKATNDQPLMILETSTHSDTVKKVLSAYSRPSPYVWSLNARIDDEDYVFLFTLGGISFYKESERSILHHLSFDIIPCNNCIISSASNTHSLLAVNKEARLTLIRDVYNPETTYFDLKSDSQRLFRVDAHTAVVFSTNKAVYKVDLTTYSIEQITFPLYATLNPFRGPILKDSICLAQTQSGIISLSKDHISLFSTDLFKPVSHAEFNLDLPFSVCTFGSYAFISSYALNHNFTTVTRVDLSGCKPVIEESIDVSVDPRSVVLPMVALSEEICCIASRNMLKIVAFDAYLDPISAVIGDTYDDFILGMSIEGEALKIINSRSGMLTVNVQPVQQLKKHKSEHFKHIKRSFILYEAGSCDEARHILEEINCTVDSLYEFDSMLLEGLSSDAKRIHDSFVEMCNAFDISYPTQGHDTVGALLASSHVLLKSSLQFTKDNHKNVFKSAVSLFLDCFKQGDFEHAKTFAEMVSASMKYEVLEELKDLIVECIENMKNPDLSTASLLAKAGHSLGLNIDNIMNYLIDTDSSTAESVASEIMHINSIGKLISSQKYDFFKSYPLKYSPEVISSITQWLIDRDCIADLLELGSFPEWREHINGVLSFDKLYLAFQLLQIEEKRLSESSGLLYSYVEDELSTLTLDQAASLLSIALICSFIVEIPQETKDLINTRFMLLELQKANRLGNSVLSDDDLLSHFINEKQAATALSVYAATAPRRLSKANAECLSRILKMLTHEEKGVLKKLLIETGAAKYMPDEITGLVDSPIADIAFEAHREISK